MKQPKPQSKVAETVENIALFVAEQLGKFTGDVVEGTVKVGHDHASNVATGLIYSKLDELRVKEKKAGKLTAKEAAIRDLLKELNSELGIALDRDWDERRNWSKQKASGEEDVQGTRDS